MGRRLRGSRRRAARLAVLVLLTASAAVAGGCGSGAGDRPNGSVSSLAASRSPSPTGLSMPAEGPITPGTYWIPASGWSVAGYSVTFGPGWHVQYGHVYALNPDTDTELGFYSVVVDALYETACGEAETQHEVPPGVDALVAALRAQPGPDVAEPVPTTLGGLSGTRVDLRVPPSLDLQTCRLAKDGAEGLQVWFSPRADKYFVLLPKAQASAHVLDAGGRRQVVLVQGQDKASDEDWATLRAVLDSLRFDGT